MYCGKGPEEVVKDGTPVLAPGVCKAHQPVKLFMFNWRLLSPVSCCSPVGSWPFIELPYRLRCLRPDKSEICGGKGPANRVKPELEEGDYRVLYL